MRMRWYWIYLTMPLLLLADECEVMKLRCIKSPNLVRNADFSQINEHGLPREWSFDNCSKSPYFKSQVIRQETANYLAINTAWKKYGYWLQNIPVKEGVSYYVACEVQSDNPSTGLWLRCKTEKKAVGKPPGRAEHLIFRHAWMGDDMREQLKDFIDEDLFVSMSAKKWVSLGKEIVIPSGFGIRLCAMRIGIYGGKAGQARFRNPVFREAQSRLEVDIFGTGWTLLRVSGAKPESVKLTPAAKKQTISVVLPKAKCIYKVELCDQKGGKTTKEVSNE